MTVNAADAVYEQAAVESTGDDNNINSELGKDAFFKLLITQLRNQDPLKPMEDKEFIAQMVQFSSLEQMSNMNDNFEKMMDIQKINQNSALVGKTVEKIINEGDETQTIKGEVIKISFEGDKTYAHLDSENVDKIAIEDISAIY